MDAIAMDAVQETFLQACAKFSQFRGNTEAELLAWLRKILVNNILSAFERHIQAEKRDIRRERPLNVLAHALQRSSAYIDAALADQAPSPSEHARQRELAAEVAKRLAELPKPDDGKSRWRHGRHGPLTPSHQTQPR